ncbi:hypothetical protein OK016_29670 [Vibrio chagasii]|nr:hypothetical protein [Vibrio chagasii]
MEKSKTTDSEREQSSIIGPILTQETTTGARALHTSTMKRLRKWKARNGSGNLTLNSMVYACT